MLRSLIFNRLSAAERDLGVSMDYVRFMVNASLGAFWKFSKVLPLSQYRRELPAEPFHIARLVAAAHEDCGTCVQIEVHLATKDRVPAEYLRATIENRPDDLPPELAEVYRFTRSVVSADGQEEELRENIRARYGDAGLVELALAIASSRIFPTTKRALGYAKSCALVKVAV